jgi:formate--tetrahydrofolate ligase
MNDLDIAKKVELKHIAEIAKKFGVSDEHIEMYGKYKAKLPLSFIDEKKAANSKLILVSAISPTPAG